MTYTRPDNPIEKAGWRQVRGWFASPSDGTNRWEMILVVAVVAIATLAGGLAVVQYRNHLRNPRKSQIPERFSYSLDNGQEIAVDRIGFEKAWQVAIPGEEIRAMTVLQSTAWIAADRCLIPVTLTAQEGILGQKIEVPVPPRSLAVAEWPDRDHQPRRFFILGNGAQVVVVQESGTIVSEWTFLGKKGIVTDLVVTGEEVFVADAGQRVVHRVDRYGEKIAEIGHRDAERGIVGFVIPSPYFSLAWNGDGLLRVVNPGLHRIELYTPNGDLEIFWGKAGLNEAGFCGCCNPANIALFKDGRLVTAEKGIPRVKVYSAQGELLSWVVSPTYFASFAQWKETRDQERLPVLDVGVFEVAYGAESVEEWVLILDPARKVVEAFRPKLREGRTTANGQIDSANNAQE